MMICLQRLITAMELDSSRLNEEKGRSFLGFFSYVFVFDLSDVKTGGALWTTLDSIKDTCSREEPMIFLHVNQKMPWSVYVQRTARMDTSNKVGQFLILYSIYQDNLNI